MAEPPKKPTPYPGIEPGDHIYYRHPQGPTSGKVLCAGKHGVTTDCEGKRHQVRWEHILGHKERMRPAVKLVDQGEDGAIVEDQKGKRRFLAGQIPEPEDEPVPEPLSEPGAHVLDALEGKEMKKSMPVLFLKAPIANRSGLTLQDVTDRAGHRTKRWKRSSPDEPAKSRDNKPSIEHEKRGSKKGYGTHHLEPGDKVSFRVGQGKASGTIEAMGEHGATVKDEDGREHKVKWTEIAGHEPKKGKSTAQEKGQSASQENQSKIPPHEFSASDFFKAHNDPDVTPDSILEGFPPDTKSKIEAANKRVQSIEQTIDAYKYNGVYDAERKELHKKIIAHFMNDERTKAARPPEGQAPTFTILGGRGGSGKSWFEGNVYDHGNAIVLDADEIKGMLPEYEGWNAAQVHEESGDLFDEITQLATDEGLNIVHDATMKTTHKAVKLVNEFKEKGYRVEAHYMHLPRQEAAKRAVARFLGKTQRFVPPEVVLSNVSNEISFDAVKPLVDKWSFRDNNVPKGHDPILISESNDEKQLQKSYRRTSGAVRSYGRQAGFGSGYRDSSGNSTPFNQGDSRSKGKGRAPEEGLAKTILFFLPSRLP